MTIGMHVHFLSRVPSPKIIMQAFAEIHPDIIIAVPLIIEKVYKSKLKPIVDRNKFIMALPILDNVIAKRFCTELTHAFGGRFEEVILGGIVTAVRTGFTKNGKPFPLHILGSLDNTFLYAFCTAFC